MHAVARGASAIGADRAWRGIGLAVLLALLWALTHRYMGMGYDAKLYAFQALAKVHPYLASDLFLQYATQDKFSIFSRIYAPFIAAFGLEPAALGLYLVLVTGFFAAAWHLCRALFDTDLAWLAVMVLAVLAGHYGAGLTFRYSENFLTARTAAECLVLAALALDLRGWTRGAWAASALAIAVHPIMGLPGLALLVGRRLPLRWVAGLALAGISLVLAAALLAQGVPAWSQGLNVMDPQWLEMTRERSQFLFVSLWTWEDWKLNLLPFVCLALYARALPDTRLRRLCWLVMLVAATGVALSAIASLVSPIALLLQAQTWRWMWLAKLFSVLLLMPTVLAVMREPAGPLCGTLLILAWTFPALEGVPAATAALALWLVPMQLRQRGEQGSRWLTLAIAAVVGVWLVGEFHTALVSEFDSGAEPRPLQVVKNFLGLQLPLLILIIAGWRLLLVARTTLAACVSLALLIAFLACAPWAFTQSQPMATSNATDEFADWRARIPTQSTVVVVTDRMIGGFIWFQLDRMAYLSEPQSAGVVFSRRTAQEIRRRSEWLQALMDPDWTVLSDTRRRETSKDEPPRARVRPLTAKTLIHACGDPLLGFVIARENIGFGGAVHQQRGPWNGWTLYDCRTARQAAMPPGKEQVSPSASAS